MIIDSSAWIEYLRRSGSPAATAVRDAIEDPATPLMTTDIVRLEILAGANEEAVRRRLNSLLAGCEDVPQIPRADVDHAVALFQACRARGDSVRAPNDCLIAAIAIRIGVPVLHADRDFDVLARHTGLNVVRS